jgi:hypothetical protein
VKNVLFSCSPIQKNEPIHYTSGPRAVRYGGW